MPVPDWFTRSGLTIPAGSETVADVPHIGANRTCYKYVDGPPGKGQSEYWIFEDGTPCKHHFPNGVDEYTDFHVVEPRAKLAAGSATATTRTAWDLPLYCPPWDSDPKLVSELPAQDYICTGFWL